MQTEDDANTAAVSCYGLQELSAGDDVERATDQDVPFPLVQESVRFRKYIDDCFEGFTFEKDVTTEEDDSTGLTSEFESTLHDAVRSSDSFVIFGCEDMRRHLILTVIKHFAPNLYTSDGHRWIVVLVKSIAQETPFKDYLDTLLYLKISTRYDILEDGHSNSLRQYDLLFLEASSFQECLQSNLISLQEVVLIVFKNLEEYLHPNGPYRAILNTIGAVQNSDLRVFATVDSLPCISFQKLEEALRILKRSYRWNCHLGCCRPHSREIDRSLIPILFCTMEDKSFRADLRSILRESDSQEAGKLLQTLKRYGPLCAYDEAEEYFYHKSVDKQTEITLQKFLDASSSVFFSKKLDKLEGVIQDPDLDHPTVVLTKHAKMQGELRHWFEQRLLDDVDFPTPISFKSICSRSCANPDMARFVLVATFGDIQVIRKYKWSTVILFDLPSQVDCNDLLSTCKKIIVITSSTKWHEWQEGLHFFDTLEMILQKINNANM